MSKKDNCSTTENLLPENKRRVGQEQEHFRGNEAHSSQGKKQLEE